MNPIIKDIWMTRIALAVWIAAALGLMAVLTKLAFSADTVGLEWTASPSAGVANYRIRFGNFPGIYHSQKQVTPRDLDTVITNLAYGTWYFAASAILTNGLESEPSNEVRWTNRVFVPLNLRITPPLDALIVQTSVDGLVWKTIGIITATNPQPLILTAEKNKMFRTISTNFPPTPAPASQPLPDPR